MIILDNSDWLPDSARLLRDADLLQVDMSGFIPIGDHTQTHIVLFRSPEQIWGERDTHSRCRA